ncbi:S8 family serine peptidase [Prochlorococcus sp. AH-736-A20]|nr:S8 family serine peptidase [Prochlorococcus sp. AH-736-A20]
MEEKDLGKLNNGIIYSYDKEISGSNQLKYIFSVDGVIYPYFTLSGMSSDLDIDLYKVTTTVKGQRNSTLIKSSQNAGIESEFFFKYLDTGNYEVLITPYKNNTNETINFNLEIDNKSFEENTTLPNDPLFKDQWYLFNTGQADAIDNYDIFAPEAWKDTSSSPKITVAVIDTGIDYNHIDLDDNIWINTGEIKNNNIDDDGNGYIDDYQGWDFYYQDNNPMDYTNHGTHVAGIIGAEGNNSIGTSGISWDVQLMNLKVFSDYSTQPYAKNVFEAIRYATDNGADIINLSLGFNLGEATNYIFPSLTFQEYKVNYPDHYQSFYDPLKYASDNGVTIIAALGNESQNTERYSSIPADFSSEIPGMISVAAFDNKGDITSYSNYGNIASIGAPGGVSSVENDPNGILSTIVNNEYKYLVGTSMASPIVAGAAALIIEKDPTLTPEEVKEKIISGGSTIKDFENIVANGRFLDLDGSLKLVSSTEDISNHSIGNFYNLKGIKDFDGYHHANSGKVSDSVKNAYKYQGLLDVNADGTKEAIYTNKESGRWVTASINSSTGEIDYSEYGQGGTTRVVGIYIDPLVQDGIVEQFGPHDSQRRFQNDLKIDNLIAKTSGDYDGDGFQEVYWKTNDGTAYLRALMHADGNIQYANYQNEEQMSDYLTSKGYESVISDII